MEIALCNEIPTYAGGLGVLAGDTLRSAADLRIPLVAVSLVSRQGYFRQEIDSDGGQVEHADPWHPEAFTRSLPAKVSVVISGREVWIRSWLYVVEGLAGGRQPVILLDTDLPENGEDDRHITDVLYGGDASYRLKQEVVLGMGGVQMLEALGFRIQSYHLNEGHSAFLTLQLLERYAYEEHGLRPGDPRFDLPRVREMCHFTTHTPVEAGHDRFSYELVKAVLDSRIDSELLQHLAGREEFNTTRLALNLSEYVNGVARSHVATSKRMFPEYELSAITNGVHPNTWTHPEFARLYDRSLPSWRAEPELLMRADCCLSPELIWDCHMVAKRQLLEMVRSRCGVTLDESIPTLGYARRMTQYKRPELLFADLDRLRTLAARYSFQVVLAGKAHPQDASGKRAIEHLHRLIRELETDIRIVFIPNYDMEIAQAMVSGVDIWLNTPEPPLEASGTSGMKAAFNGVPHLSVLDGWWLEGHIEGITGWAIGNGAPDMPSADVSALFDKLEQVVLPLFSDRDAWVSIMQGVISRNASMFHSHRMMRRYAAEAYLR